MTAAKKGGAPLLGGAVDNRGFLLRLVLAEVLARPGEGPLTPRFARPPAGFGRSPSPREPEAPKTTEPR